MPTSQRLRTFTGAILAALVDSAALGGCQASGSANGTSSPSITAASRSPLAIADGGTITLTDDGCSWEANPGSTSEGRLRLAVRNETDDYGVFTVHRLYPGRTFDEGRAAIAAIQEALMTGADWPEPLSYDITEATAEAGLDSDVTVLATAGTFGVVCSANTSPTGDVLTVFLVGPLEVTSS